MKPDSLDPFDCPGHECHSGQWAEFDHFCDALSVQTDELPHAFAAFLGHRTGWDGRYSQLAGGTL